MSKVWQNKSIGEWQEWVKSCNESGKSKAAFCRAIAAMEYSSSNTNGKINRL